MFPREATVTNSNPQTSLRPLSDPVSQMAAGSLPTSLDHSETTGDSLPWQTRSQQHIHARDSIARTSIYAALAASSDARLQKRATRIAECCSHPLLCLRSDGKPYVSLQACRDRCCPHCQRIRGRVCSTGIACEVARFNAPRFLTLTLQHRPATLAAELQRLAASFRRLRQRPEFRRHITGGVYAVEVTFNVSEERWHVHLHIIADGSFWDQKSLSKVWHAVTGDSFIVDIRSVPDREKTARYIAQYVAKPTELHRWPAARICEFADAMHGRRLLHTFGSAHGRRVVEEEPEPSPASSETLCSLTTLIRYSDAGDTRAQYVRALLRRLGTGPAAAAALPPIPPTEPRSPITDDEITTLVQYAREIREENIAARLAADARKAIRQAERVKKRQVDERLFPEPPNHGRVL